MTLTAWVSAALLAVAIATIALAGCSGASDRPPPSSSAAAADTSMYVIGPGDTLSVFVYRPPS